MTMRFKLYAVAALCAIAAAAAHAFAIQTSLYWSLSWFDFPVHAIAGVMVGIVSYLVASWTLSHRFSLPAAFILLLGVGLAWEIFEYLVGTSFIDDPAFFADTIQDLFADLLGGGLAIWMSHRLLDPGRLS